MCDLVSIVTKLRSEIQGIKTSQATQADSYQFYKYTTGNIWQANKTATITFSPLTAETNNVVCQFKSLDYNMIDNVIGCKFSNPLQAQIIMSSSGSGTGHIRNEVYVTCISNVKGVLTVSIS